MRTARAEWAKRVERWADSGLTSKEFAAELGINPRSLVFWIRPQPARGASPLPRYGRLPLRNNISELNLRGQVRKESS